MGSSSSRQNYPGAGDWDRYPQRDLYEQEHYPGRGGPGPWEIQKHDYSRWGYIILYLVILLGGLLLNGIFVWTIKKNKPLHKTAHFLLACLACRDILVVVVVFGPCRSDKQCVYSCWLPTIPCHVTRLATPVTYCLMRLVHGLRKAFGPCTVRSRVRRVRTPDMLEAYSDMS